MLLVEQMRRLLGGVPVGALEPADLPDVCVVTGEHRIGVEVTELHRASAKGQGPRRDQDSERSGVVAHAQTLAEAKSIPLAAVVVHFNTSVPIAKGDREAIATQLVELVSQNMPALDQPTSLNLWQETGNQLPWIRLLNIYRFSSLTKHHWSAPTAGWVQMDFIHELQQVYRRKERTLRNVP